MLSIVCKMLWHAQGKAELQASLDEQMLQVSWLSNQNATLESQLDQVTNSLREFVQKKTTAEHLTHSQSRVSD